MRKKNQCKSKPSDLSCQPTLASSPQCRTMRGHHGRNSDVLAKVALLLVLLPHMAQTKYARDSTRVPRFKFAEMQNHTVRVGSEATFACIVEQLGTYKVAWLHSEKGTLAVYPNVITQNDRISLKHDNRHAYYLVLRDIQESDAGKYICQLNTDPPVSIGGSLNVVVPPDIIDEESSSDTLATEGMPVTLVCKARGNPRTQIAWRREDGKAIRLCQPEDIKMRPRSRSHSTSQRDCREVSVHYGSELSLPHVSRHDSGVYFCLASNGVPPTVSKKVRLYVDFPPTLWISHQLIGASAGEAAELECLTAAHPPSLNFWTRDGNNYIIPTAGKYEFEQVEGKPAFYNIRMKLRIYNVSVADFGTYRCLAKNSQGETTGDIELYELPKPSTTTIITYIEEYDEKAKEQEIPSKNVSTTQIIVAPPGNDSPADFTNIVPKIPTSRDSRFNDQRQENRRYQQVGFHSDGDDETPVNRFGLNGSSKLCQRQPVFLLIIMFGSLFQ